MFIAELVKKQSKLTPQMKILTCAWKFNWEKMDKEFLEKFENLIVAETVFSDYSYCDEEDI